MAGLRFFLAVFHFIFFCLLIISFQLQLSLAADVPGFIYIDCGVPDDSTDVITGLPYRSDKYFIESGVSRWIPPQSHLTYAIQYKSLRSFPEGERNCYTVKLEDDPVKNNNTYLVRAVFVYGNYDGKNQTPIFDLYLGVNKWMRGSLEDLFIEANYMPSTNYIEMCLVNIGNGIPYISTLELRRLDVNSIYPIQNGFLTLLWKRFDIGGSDKRSARYPEDIKYDRYWEQLERNDWISISTKEVIPTSHDDLYKVPQLVLATASTTQNSSTPLNFFFYSVGSNPVYFCLHFVEIEKIQTGKLREMSIVFNNAHVITNSIKLDYLKRHTICSNRLNVNVGQQNNLSISSTPNSNLPPILNALEIFYSSEFPSSPSFLQDVNAIMEIKRSYGVRKNWQGDPCIPTSYIWDGLNCSNVTSPRIISLNLSKSKLTGDIVFSFSNLTKLESLDLSHNDLRGPIPEFFAQLPHLKLLNLTGNNLIGLVPETLLQKSKDGTLLLSVNENPELCLSPPCKEKKRFSIPVLAYIIPITVVFILIFLAVLIIVTRKRKWNSSTESNRKGALKPKNQQYKYSEVMSMTDGLKTIIGEGGFGKVYLGTLNDKTLVAVKLLSKTSKQGYKEFQAEAQLLMIVHHQNLVSLVGYCDEGDNKVLIYEYMANGNVQQHLSGTNVRFLNWTERLRIALDAAQGLEYLHNGCMPPILHRDMKTSNILLNEKMQAKIADFGLSRILASESVSHLSTTPAGTIGYIDPEIHTSGNFTKKSDVYSFGIVLFELITGEPAIIKNGECNVHIVRWIKTLIEEGNIENVVDWRLKGSIEHGSAWKVVELAISCTLSSSDQRPNMSCVVMELTECLKMVQCRIQPISSESHENFSYASIGSESILSPR